MQVWPVAALHELLCQSKAANDKARKLGWIG